MIDYSLVALLGNIGSEEIGPDREGITDFVALQDISCAQFPACCQVLACVSPHARYDALSPQ